MARRTSPIASALPGRLRLRHPSLRHRGRHRELAERLAALDGVRVAESDPAVGSLLILYDPAQVGQTATEARVAAIASAVLATASDPAADGGATTGRTPAPSVPVPSLKRRINRASKIGMLGGMAATLAALGVGKRLHAGAGALFVALMLAHVTIHRRRLFQ